MAFFYYSKHLLKYMEYKKKEMLQFFWGLIKVCQCGLKKLGATAMKKKIA